MNAGARLFPLDLSRRDVNALTLTSVAVLNRVEIASQHHGYSLTWIAMPRHSLSGSKTQTTHYRGSVMKHQFVGHGGIAFSEM
jgi:hypothetical protein